VPIDHEPPAGRESGNQHECCQASDFNGIESTGSQDTQ
jgi:hypothetical protein